MSEGMTREEISGFLTEIAVTKLRLAPDRLKPEALLRDDLDLDSIDMFDILSYVEDKTGRVLEGEKFRDVRTVSDLVETLHGCMN